MWNLLTNAVRYTPAGGCITVTGKRIDGSIRLRVEDTGAGIPAEHLPHIFERFRQVDSSATRSKGGLGLGLAIVRHLVEAHGGSVEARSAGPAQGASFTILLPIRALDPPAAHEADEDAVRDVAPSTMPVEAVRSLGGVRVLLVDDDADSLELVGMALKDAGASVTSVRSAREALAARGPFDVIVSDIGMPEVDGYSLVRRIRSRDQGADVPALALTAYAREVDAERALRAGFQEHLAKPVEHGKLLDSVKRWAKMRESNPD
jgi:CheY-like chemotaxis protein